MQGSIKKRIKALERDFKERRNGMITVVYKGGKSRTVYPGEALLLSITEGEKIDHCEEEGGKNGGIVEGLVNALLLPGMDPGKDGKQ